MLKLLKVFERFIVTALLIMLMAVIGIATIELGVTLVMQGVGQEMPELVLDLDEMLGLFGFFLMVLIGLELTETVYAYLKEDVIHVEVVVLVAIVAVARKVIILDYKDLDPAMLYGIAAVLLALSAGYFLLRKVLRDDSLARKGDA